MVFPNGSNSPTDMRRMKPDDIKRYNVFTQIDPNGNQDYYLESWDGEKWDCVTYQNRRLNYDSLDYVAQRIVQLSPNNNTYKRIIFSNEPMESRDGRLNGIELHNGKPRLIDSLTRDEKVTLLGKIQKYFNELEKRR